MYLNLSNLTVSALYNSAKKSLKKSINPCINLCTTFPPCHELRICIFFIPNRHSTPLSLWQLLRSSMTCRLRLGHFCALVFLHKIRVRHSSLCESGLNEGALGHIFFELLTFSLYVSSLCSSLCVFFLY